MSFELLMALGAGGAALAGAGLRTLLRRRRAGALAAFVTPLELRRLGGRPPRFLAQVHGREVELWSAHGRIEFTTALDAPMPPGFALARQDHPATASGELRVGDPAFDARVRIESENPAAALRLVGHAEVRSAIDELFSRYEARLEGGRIQSSAPGSAQLADLRAALAQTARVAECLEAAAREEARSLEEAKLHVRATAPVEPAHPPRAPLQASRERQIVAAYERRLRRRNRLVAALMYPGLGMSFALCYAPVLDLLHLSGQAAMELFFVGAGMLFVSPIVGALFDRCPACNKWLGVREEGVLILSCPRCGARLRERP